MKRQIKYQKKYFFYRRTGTSQGSGPMTYLLLSKEVTDIPGIMKTLFIHIDNFFAISVA